MYLYFVNSQKSFEMAGPVMNHFNIVSYCTSELKTWGVFEIEEFAVGSSWWEFMLSGGLDF